MGLRRAARQSRAARRVCYTLCLGALCALVAIGWAASYLRQLIAEATAHCPAEDAVLQLPDRPTRPMAPHGGRLLFTVSMVADLSSKHAAVYNGSVMELVAYTRLHHYQLNVAVRPWRGSEDAPAWGKLNAVHHAIEELLMYRLPVSPPGSTGWVWSLDSDAFVMNSSITLESIVRQYGGRSSAGHTAHVIIGRDCNGVNGGSVLYRADKWTLAFLARAIALRRSKDPCMLELVRRTPWYWEQNALECLVRHGDVQQHVRTVRMQVFNSYLDAFCGDSYEYGHMVLHLAGPSKRLYLDGNSDVKALFDEVKTGLGATTRPEHLGRLL